MLKYLPSIVMKSLEEPAGQQQEYPQYEVPMHHTCSKLNMHECIGEVDSLKDLFLHLEHYAK